jgi:hypothetical protein
MKINCICGCALVCATAVALSGCQSLAAFNNALLPTLKPIDATIHTDHTCAEFADSVLAQRPDTDSRTLQLWMHACEGLNKDHTLTLDPQAARKALEQALKPSRLAAGALVAPITP